MTSFDYERPIVQEILAGLAMKKKLLHIMTDPGRWVKPLPRFKSEINGGDR